MEARADLLSYVPARLARRLGGQDLGAPRLDEEHFSGAILFADISGFTRLTERLAAAGPEGAETLTEVLNAYFDTLLAVITRHGGEVLRFAGDAAIAVWEGPARDCVPRAAGCGWEIQQAMAAREPVAGESLQLRVGVSCGELRTAHVGGASGRWECLLGGSPVARMGPAAAAAEPGEVVLTAAAAELLEHSGKPLPDGHVRMIAPLAAPPEEEPARLPAGVPEEALRPFISRTVLERLDAGQGDWVAEFRRVTVAFVNVDGIDYGAEDALAVLQAATAAIQAAIYRYGGSVNQLINDDKGTTLIAAWGLPSSAHEDDAVRGVSAASAVAEALAGVGLEASIGVTTGRAFCGLRGAERRREYAMIGAVVNRSARLMQAAGGGVLADAATVDAVGGALDFEAAGTIQVKGGREPVPVSRPQAGERRARARGGDIIGREEERDHLRRSLDALRDGAPATVVLEGEAGIGKSMLLDFCTRQARELGLTVLSGAADAVENSTSYYVWRGVLRGLFEGFQGDALREEVLRRLDDDTLRSWAPLLSVLLPLELPDNEITAQMTGLARAETVRTLVVQLLQEAASRSPLLVLLDDGHWFDSASWALALDVTRRVKPALLLIATRPLPDPLPPEFARIVESGAALRLALPPLPAEDALALIQRRLEVEELPSAVAEFIRERSQGNPFFSEQLAYALRDSGTLRIEAHRARLASGVTDLAALDLPDTMQGVITGRIDALSPQQQLTLKVASAIGRVFAYRALWDVHPVEGDRPGLPDQLDDMNQRDLILVESPDPELAYLFKHVVLQDVVYNLMSFRQRRRLHRAFALWLEERHAGNLSPYLPLLAHHWKQTDDTEKALHYLERAGEQALNNYANTEALRFLGEAVELADAHPGLVDDDRRSRWEYWRGIALIKLSLYDESDECFRRGLGLIGHGLPKTRFGMGLDLAGQILRQVGHRLVPGLLTRKTRHQEALRNAATLHQHHAECFYFHQDVLGLVHASVRTMNDAERAGDADDLARAYATMAIVGQVSGLHRIAYWYSDRSLELIDEMEQLPEVAYVTMLAMVSRLSMDNGTYQEQYLERSTELFERLGDSFRLETALACGAFLRYSGGDFAGVCELTDRIHASGWPDGAPQTQVWGLGIRVCTDLIQGRPPGERIEQLERVLELGVDTGTVLLGRGALALAYLVAGDADRSWAAAEATCARMKVDPPTTSVGSYGMAAAAWALLLLWERGAVAAARPAAELCRVLRRLGRTAVIVRPPALYFSGRWHSLAGDEKKAVRAWRAATEVDPAIEAPYFTARACYALSRSEIVAAQERGAFAERARAGFEELEAIADPFGGAS